MKIDICTGKSRKDKVWNYEEINLSTFIKRISTTTRTSETMKEYKNLPKAAKDDIKDVGGCNKPKRPNTGHGLCHSRYYR